MVSDTKRRVQLNRILADIAVCQEDFVNNAEEYYREQAEQVAAMFCAGFPENRVILLAGPSSSGKTTTSYNLQAALNRHGIDTIQISLDDFFKSREEAPLLDDGTPDLETVDLVDTELLETCLADLFAFGSRDFPIYDFAHGGRSSEVRPIQLGDHTALIIEGLHALNPVICAENFCKHALKVYISIKTEFYDGDQRLLSTRELRLIRRIIRDANFRGCPPPETMEMWKNVVRGEDHYIRPFRKDADFWLDSVHLYEPCIYRPLFEELIQNVCWQQPDHRETAEKLAKSLAKFPAFSTKCVPKDSLLREFIILP